MSHFCSQGQKVPQIRGGPDYRSKHPSFITLTTVVWQLNWLVKEVEVMIYWALRDLERSELLKPFTLIRGTEAHLKSRDVVLFIFFNHWKHSPTPWPSSPCSYSFPPQALPTLLCVYEAPWLISSCPSPPWNRPVNCIFHCPWNVVLWCLWYYKASCYLLILE